MKDLPYWPAVLRREAAAAYLSLSAGTLDAAVAAGEIPKPVPLVGNIKGWRRGDLDAWLAERHDVAARKNSWDE